MKQRHVIIQCPNCARWQDNVTTKELHYMNFNCKRCGKSRRLKDKNQLDYNLNVKLPKTQQEAVSVVQKLNGSGEYKRLNGED